MYSVYVGPFLPQKLGSTVPSRQSSALDSTHSKPRKQSQWSSNESSSHRIHPSTGGPRLSIFDGVDVPISASNRYPGRHGGPSKPARRDQRLNLPPNGACTPRQRAPERRWRWVQLLTSPCANGVKADDLICIVYDITYMPFWLNMLA